MVHFLHFPEAHFPPLWSTLKASLPATPELLREQLHHRTQGEAHKGRGKVPKASVRWKLAKQPEGLRKMKDTLLM